MIFKSYDKHHSTALETGILANKICHYIHTEDKNLKTHKSSYSKETSQCFQGNAFVPNDWEIIPLNQ